MPMVSVHPDSSPTKARNSGVGSRFGYALGRTVRGRALALLAAVGVLLAVTTCSFADVLSRRTHADEHEGEPWQGADTSICFESFVGVLPGGGSDQRGAHACDYGAKWDLFFGFPSPAALERPHNYVALIEDGGLPVHRRARASFTPCGLRAPPGHLRV